MKILIKTSLFHVVVCGTLLAISSVHTASAALGEHRSLEQKVQMAELIFTGTVVDVQYRFKQQNEDASQMPYTFVTFGISRVLKGNYSSPTVTLRFMGGPIDEDNIMLLSGVPLFDAGEEGLFMVKGNNKAPCPLVNCSGGRYRFIDGMVVSEIGQRVYLDADGELLEGEHIESDEIANHNMGDNMTLGREQSGTEAAEALPEITEIRFSAIPPDIAGFGQHFDETIQRVHSYEELAALPEFESADPDKLFTDSFFDPKGSGDAPPEQPLDEPDDAMPPAEKMQRELDAEYMEAVKSGMSKAELSELMTALRQRFKTAFPEHYLGDNTPVEESVTAPEIVNQATFAGVPKSRVALLLAAFLFMLAGGAWIKKTGNWK